MFSYLQLGRRSSSPHPPHRQPTASLCSSARSVRQESDIHTDTHTHQHTESHAFKQTHTHTQIPTGGQYMYVQMPQTYTHTIHNKCISHEKPNSPTVYKCNSFTVKLLLYLFTFSEATCMSGGIWEAVIENQGLSIEIMEWDVGVEAKAAQIDASLRRFTEQNQTAQTNGMASIHFSFWNGQHGLLMSMELAIKKLSDSCSHTLLPSKGSSFSSESEKRDRNMCEWAFFGYLLVLLLEDIQLIIQTTQNQTSREWASANTVLIPQWTKLTFSQIDYV